MLDVILVLLVLATLWRNLIMSQKLTDSVNALIEETADTNGKLESIRTFLTGVPDLVASAVAGALEAANVDDDTAATQIDEARAAISDKVDETLAAIEANPAPGDEPAPPAEEEPPVEEPPVE